MELNGLIGHAEEARLLGIIVSQDSEQKARWMLEAPFRRNVYSAAKSFTSAAVGIAVREGLVSLDEKLTDAFPQDLPEVISENLAAATVRDLLTMCLGQEKGFLMGADRPYYENRNWAQLALSQPFVYRPGTHFVYNNSGPYLAGLLVQRRSGTDLVHYLMPRFFEPMGIQLPTWETDPNGNTFGAGGLFLTIDELHQFGRLYQNNGRWNGKQLVPEEWVRESTRKQADNGSEGYGYLFWRGKYNSFRADGKYEQYTIVYEDKHAVVTTCAESRVNRKVLQLVEEYIYPQL